MHCPHDVRVTEEPLTHGPRVTPCMGARHSYLLAINCATTRPMNRYFNLKKKHFFIKQYLTVYVSLLIDYGKMDKMQIQVQCGVLIKKIGFK